MHPPLIVGKGDEGSQRIAHPKASAHIGTVVDQQKGRNGPLNADNFTTFPTPTYTTPEFDSGYLYFIEKSFIDYKFMRYI